MRVLSVPITFPSNGLRFVNVSLRKLNIKGVCLFKFQLNIKTILLLNSSLKHSFDGTEVSDDYNA